MTLKEKYESITIDDFEKYISNKQEEHSQLEFKTIKNSNLRSADDKKNLAKCLSGFANSEGGLIVWGVEAKKNEEDIDCATKLIPINKIDLFISRLNELTGDAIKSQLSGIVHKKIVKEADTGFAITYVPESETLPHMAKLGEDRYYKRSGDSLYKMEHYDIADMFGKRPNPKLILKYNFNFDFTKPGAARFLITLILHNLGRGSAKGIMVSIKEIHKFDLYHYGIDGNFGYILKPQPRDKLVFNGFHFLADSNFMLHPESFITIAKYVREFPKGASADHLKDVNIDYYIAAENHPRKPGNLKITNEMIHKEYPDPKILD